MPKVMLVTGGCGFIGSCFILQELRMNPDLRLVNVDSLTYAGNPDNVREVAEDPRYRFVRADVADRPAVEQVFAEEHPTQVVHFAAESHVDRSITDPGIFMRTNALGSGVMLDAALHAWHRDGCLDTARFVYISTDEVYGDLPLDSTEEFTEESPLHPNSPYSVSKAAGDLLAQACYHTYGMPALVTRSSNNFGPRQYPEKLIPLTIRRALAGEPIPIYGDGRNVRDWLYVEDNCRAIDAVLRQGIPGRVYNIAGGNEMSNRDVVHLVLRALAEYTGVAVEQYEGLITAVPDRPGHDRRYALCDTHIREALGWEPRTAITAGLRKAVADLCDRWGPVSSSSAPSQA